MSICKHFWAAGMAFWMLIVIADRVFDVAVWHDSDIKTKDRESSFNQGTSASSPELSDWVAESDFFLYCLNGLKSLEGIIKRTHSCCHWWVVEGKIQDEVPKLVDICYWFIDSFQKEPPLEATKLFLQMKENFAILFRYHHGDGQLCHILLFYWCDIEKKWEVWDVLWEKMRSRMISSELVAGLRRDVNDPPPSSARSLRTPHIMGAARACAG